jgi:hypothetical protein
MCTLETNVTVHDGASSQEVNATELSVTSEGRGKCWVPWTRRADKHLALLVGHLNLPGFYDFIWRELMGLRGKNSNFWSSATPPPPPADQLIYLSFMDGSIWRSHWFPIPLNSKHINHQRKLFIFWREILLTIGYTQNKNYHIWSYPESNILISIYLKFYIPYVWHTTTSS